MDLGPTHKTGGDFCFSIFFHFDAKKTLPGKKDFCQFQQYGISLEMFEMVQWHMLWNLTLILSTQCTIKTTWHCFYEPSFCSDLQRVNGNRVKSSVAMKIENGPKTNTKILRFLKMDRRQIQRIFVNSKILRRSSKIRRFSKEYEKFSLLKIFFQAATWTNFPSSRTFYYMGKIEVQSFKKSTYF